MFFQKNEPSNDLFGQKGALKYQIYKDKKKSKYSVK